MKQKASNGTIIVACALIGLLLVPEVQAVQQHQRQGLHQRMRSHVSTNGIFDRMMLKLSEKEIAQKAQQEVEDKKHMLNLLKAQQQAQLMVGQDQNMEIEDLSQILDNDVYATGAPKKVDLSPENFVNNAVSREIQSVVDDFEGFGSLTEMVRNKDKLIEKELNTPIKDPESIKSAKDVLKDKLDQVAKEKKEKEENEKKLAQQKENFELQRLSSMSEDDRRDQMVSDIIDELQTDQDMKHTGSSSIASQVVDDDLPGNPKEDAGFIKKFTDKQVQEKQNEEYEKNQMRLMEQGIAYVPEPVAKVQEPQSKGIAARFADKIKEEEDAENDTSITGMASAFQKASGLAGLDDGLSGDISFLQKGSSLRFPPSFAEY